MNTILGLAVALLIFLTLSAQFIPQRLDLSLPLVQDNRPEFNFLYPDLPLISQGTYLIPQSPVSLRESVKELEIRQEINRVADKYGVSRWIMLSLCYCESRFNPEATGDSGMAYGLYQWHLTSWKHFAGIYHKRYDLYLLRNNWKDQIELTGFVLARGGENHWLMCFNKIYASK